nr:MAG TPA: hypothetical protein [Crassvirales sp.]
MLKAILYNVLWMLTTVNPDYYVVGISYLT